MKVCIICLFTESWDALASIHLDNTKQYIRGKGYLRSSSIAPEPFDGFRKIEYCICVFNFYDVEAVWVRDVDSIITNMTVKVEDFMEDGKDLFICKDFNSINAGSFIIRKSAWSQNFLMYILEQQGKDGMDCEQNAIEAYMKEFPNDSKIKILPHPSINSYLYENYPEIPPQKHERGQWQEGDFVLHLPGIGMEKRKEILENIKIIYE